MPLSAVGGVVLVILLVPCLTGGTSSQDSDSDSDMTQTEAIMELMKAVKKLTNTLGKLQLTGEYYY